MRPELKSGWTLATIIELCDLNPKHSTAIPDTTEVSFVPMEQVDQSRGVVESSRVRKLGELRKGYTHIADEDVIFAKITPCMENGKSAVVRSLVNGLGAGSTEFFVLRSKGATLPGYVLSFLRQESTRNRARAAMTGVVGQARVPRDFVERLELPLPPLPEQRRIVAKIETLIARSRRARAALDAIPPLIEKFKQSVLAAAFRGDLTAEWRKQHPDVEPASELLKRIRIERRRRWEEAELAKMKAASKLPKDDRWKEKYKEPESLDTEGLPELPEGWCWVRAEQVCAFITKGTTPAADKMQEASGEIPFIKVYNLTFDGQLDFSVQPTFITRDTHVNELSRSKVFPGDVLMNIVGPPLGKVSIVPQTHAEWNINQAIAVFRTVPGLSNEYVAFALATMEVLHRAQSKAKATAGQSNLTLEICRDLPLPLCPEGEQGLIVGRLRSALTAAQIVRASVGNLADTTNNLEQSILAKAFRGELVHQDPSDEPASVMLERMKK